MAHAELRAKSFPLPLNNGSLNCYFFINPTVSFIFRKIPSYLPSLPSNGGNELVEVVEFDSSDDQGWFTVQNDIPEDSSSGFGNIIGLQVLSLNQF